MSKNWFFKAVIITDETDNNEVWEKSIHSTTIGLYQVMNLYLSEGKVTDEDIASAIYELEVDLLRLKMNVLSDFDYSKYKLERAEDFVKDSDS